MVNGLSIVLRRGIEPLHSFTGARDYARLAVASWTTAKPWKYITLQFKHFSTTFFQTFFKILSFWPLKRLISILTLENLHSNLLSLNSFEKVTGIDTYFGCSPTMGALWAWKIPGELGKKSLFWQLYVKVLKNCIK